MRDWLLKHVGGIVGSISDDLKGLALAAVAGVLLALVLVFAVAPARGGELVSRDTVTSTYICTATGISVVAKALRTNKRYLLYDLAKAGECAVTRTYNTMTVLSVVGGAIKDWAGDPMFIVEVDPASDQFEGPMFSLAWPGYNTTYVPGEGASKETVAPLLAGGMEDPLHVHTRALCDEDSILLVAERLRVSTPGMEFMASMFNSKSCTLMPAIYEYDIVSVVSWGVDFEGDLFAVVEVGDGMFSVAWPGFNSNLVVPDMVSYPFGGQRAAALYEYDI
jgi:hypothetical protein|tara:strand:- start:8358 stop:9191 length:834 start_codon:yes stop_codon:yes gene_type:complete